MSEADWDTVENATVIKEVLEGRIEELLNEKAEIMREYANEKSKIIQDYENKKSEMMRDYLNENAAESKISEFKRMQLKSVGLKSSPEPIRSLSVGKRPYRESSEQQYKLGE
ncbi:hypothetical protein V2W45_1348716 [Cenococcum geophilum]